jgi:MFS family permease
MLLKLARYLALVYAVALAVAEAVINSSRGEWQYAPMWIIDYVIVAGLLAGVWATRRGRYIPILMAAYALSAGVLYIAFFLSFDPELPEPAREGGIVVVLMGAALAASIAGLIGSTATWLPEERGRLRGERREG